MNPRDALHQQEMLHDACTRSRTRQYLAAVMDDIKKKKTGPVIEGPHRDTAALALAQLLEGAETFYVSEDMGLVAEAASHGLDGTDAFTHDMWPTETGFLLFERGFGLQDVWGREVITNAIAWQRRSATSEDGKSRHAGTMVWEFSLLGDERDTMTRSMSAQEQADLAHDMGTRLQLQGTAWIGDGMRVGPPTWETPEGYDQHLEPEIEAKLRPEDRADKSAPQVGNIARIYMALLMLMEQKIAAKERHDLKPKNAKRARRMKVPGQVTIIRLRHEAAQREPGETNVEWQHRWLVRGHWRWQYVGPHYPLAVEVEPGKYRARIYIAPFVKGPDDAPFKVTKKVNALIR